MNKIKYYIMFMLAGILISSACTDLEEEPVGLLSPESFFKTTQDVETAVMGGYGYIASEEMWGRKLTATLMLRSDMVDIGDPTTSSRRIEVNEFNMGDNNGMITEFWPRMYAVIGAVNYAIEGGENLDVAEEEVNPFIAEGRFLRAFTYYHLVRLFGEIPYIDYPVKDASAVSKVAKSSVDDVYSGIIADLEFAKQWLPDEQAVRTRPGKGTAAAYLASVYLTRGDFDNAYKEAKYVIDNKAKFGLELTPDFQDLFDAMKVDNNKELLFAIDFKGLDSDGNLGTDYLASLTGPRGPADEGWSVAVPAIKVFTTWDYRDYRRAVSFDTVAVMSGTDTLTYWTDFGKASKGVSRPHIAKYYRYPGTAGLNARDSDHNYPAMRYAEVLLIAAEALNEINSGPTAEAEGYIDEVRARARNWAGTTTAYPEDVPTGLSADEFRSTVMEERRLELAFECKRWYDIKRRKLGTEAFSASGLEPEPNFNADRDYLLPIPGDELTRNSNLLPQNPGY